MEFRKSIKSDIDSIMNIIKQAQEYLKNQGLDQWQNNYPNIDTINQDIDNVNSYVLVDNGKILGTVVVILMGGKKNL